MLTWSREDGGAEALDEGLTVDFFLLWPRLFLAEAWPYDHFRQSKALIPLQTLPYQIILLPSLKEEHRHHPRSWTKQK
jgi:hypothetical protein